MKKIFKYTHVIATYLFLYVPIVVLIAFSFNSKSFPSPWSQFSLRWYRELFQEVALWNSFLTSFIIASCSTALSLFLGCLLIYFFENGGKSKRTIPLFFGSLIIPEIVLAVGLVSYFSLFDVPLGMPTLIVSHTVLGLGFVIPIIYVRYQNLDPRLKEASLDLGASVTHTFFHIILPQLRPTMIATGLLVFIISFDDFVISYFCAGTHVQTLSLYLLSMIRQGISPVVNALSTLLFVLSSLLVWIFFSPKVKARIF